MKCIIQRVQEASVSVNGQVIGQINQGFLVLLGIEAADTQDDQDKVLKKMLDMRIFPNGDGKFDKSLIDIKGDLLVVSQFTLMADCKKGRRPSFTDAAEPDKAKAMCDQFIEAAKKAPIGHVASGEFGANMQVALVNDGPVTIPLDSNTL
ncbi:D-tyrosyl-tRNA(Tyr) deacylase [Candidatus Marinamargulisbacteria bacterium SCGC AG-343-K17]|nr:D-tyrosyl-tRNA(Tyr) deacylase [Candidatus Marinamargulisbacteria bacterium SCGC AG-343-K17]